LNRAVQAAEFAGTTLVLAPHMDDESLGCGLLLASRPDKQRLHVGFATDGARSPARPGQTRAEAKELAALRRQEALAALGVLGVPEGNTAFLDFEDGTLRSRRSQLEGALASLIGRLQPAWVFVPFRYDRHPDHLALRAAASAACKRSAGNARLAEYFVYTQWRLLRSGDVRDYVSAEHLRCLQPDPLAMLKRRALECHRSQTTCCYSWQTRPILTRELLDRVCGEPEYFLLHDPAIEGRAVLARGRTWVPVAHRLEPLLKRWKDRLGGWRGT
jgi:LmbE family N-acetylglucosaminyl deacetylase